MLPLAIANRRGYCNGIQKGPDDADRERDRQYIFRAPASLFCLDLFEIGRRTPKGSLPVKLAFADTNLTKN
jgi:hypothetical protein